MSSSRKRYAIVGTGGRSAMFINAIGKTHREHAELVGLCDVSQVRMDYWNRHIIGEFGDASVPTYHADDFDRMVREQKPDAVIVTTVDGVHHRYIIRALELGCEVVTEKPMTIDEKKASAIFGAIERTGGKVTVTFNYRYAPHTTKLREVVMQGMIGQPLLVDFMWTLDTSHGADYFRRWHREKEHSGGLLVHKATHHFDLVNFWIDSVPRTVFAMGSLKFYGRENARARGEERPYDRYTGEPAAKDDPFALDLKSRKNLEGLYLDAESDSGYLRDRNVFGDGITIEDTMGVLATYRNGVQLNYSLVACSPWEGFRVAITGTKGRVELYDRHGSHIIAGQSDDELAAEQAKQHVQEMTYFPMFGVPQKLEIPKAAGGHGGGDARILDQIFLPDPPPDPYRRRATHVDGAASIMLGVAANRSIETGQAVQVDDLLVIPERPDVEPASAGAAR
ncbi:MAG: Gfo/Idh/MocA family oxidoreductase [Phycisphaeraceae bacterium]